MVNSILEHLGRSEHDLILNSADDYFYTKIEGDILDRTLPLITNGKGGMPLFIIIIFFDMFLGAAFSYNFGT